jgi:hypothetical protein
MAKNPPTTTNTIKLKWSKRTQSATARQIMGKFYMQGDNSEAIYPRGCKMCTIPSEDGFFYANYGMNG